MSPIQASLQRVFVQCLETILQPIVRLTLFCGLGHSEFSAATRRVFIDVATKEYGLRGRPANIAKVAAKTGLPRKVIQRHRSRPSSDWTPDEETSPLNTIIHYWRFDDRFSLEPGSPRELSIEGENSFTSLVKSCAGDIPVSTIRQELLREEIAIQSEEGTISLSKDYSFPERLDEDFLRNAAFSVKHHIETLIHNATLIDADDGSRPKKIETGRFERLVWSRHLDVQGAERFQQWVRENGSTFIQEAEESVSALEDRDPKQSPRTRILAGVGLFFFRNR